MKKELNNPPKRKGYLDALRLIAIIMVFFNHTGINGFVLFTNAQDSVF